MRMRLHVLALAAALAAAPRAHADATADVDRAIRAHLASFGKDDTAAVAATGKVHLDGKELPPSEATNFGVELLGNFSGSATITTSGPLTIVVDPGGHAAWFHGRATIKYKEVVGEGIDGWATPVALRISGVAVDDGGWKLARVVYTTAIADARMIERTGNRDPLPAASGPPSHAGDDAIAKAADAWFPGGLVASASAGAKLVANGTAPTEYAGDRVAALKLANSWDRLKLGATEIHTAAIGPLGFVRAVVRLPVKPPHPLGKGPYAAEMVLHAVVVNEGGA